MTWREERDALIAQTIAFVESVTGKPPDFAQFAPLSEQSSQPPQSNAVPQANLGTPAQPIAAMVASPVDGDKTPETETASTGFPSSQKTGVDSADFGSCHSEPRGSEPATPQTTKTEFASELFRKQPSLAAQLDWRRDMQTEIRARIASFRAHQERFNHERQEYFSTTLARLRASAPKASSTEN